MLLNLLLANTTILLYFVFLFRVIFNNFYKIPAVTENAKINCFSDETIKNLSKLSKGAIYLRSLLLINSLSLISAIQ